MSASPSICSALDTASSLDAVESALAALRARDDVLSAQLSASASSPIPSARSIDHLSAQLSAHTHHARTLGSSILTDAAATASRLSSAVRAIDTEHANVKATLALVDDVIALRDSIAGLATSIGPARDWDTAAAHVNKALSLPDDVIDSPFADAVVPTADHPDRPRVTVTAAADSLCRVFEREFEAAVKAGDGAAVTRYFKLFPLIHRHDVGLDRYGRYVCGGITARARLNLATDRPSSGSTAIGQFYATALTRLFEHIAHIVDHHSRVVEAHYGVGTMMVVAERIQAEADIQGGIVVDAWYEDLAIARRLADIAAYSFPALSPAFAPVGPDADDSDSDPIGPQELNVILNQCATMLNRWRLYVHFLAFRPGPDKPSPDHTSDTISTPPFVRRSGLATKTDTNLATPFSTLVVFFFRRSLDRAVRSDQPPVGLSLQHNKPIPVPGPYTSTVVDDAMYILHQVVTQTMSTATPDVVTSTMSALAHVVVSDLVGLIERRLRPDGIYFPGQTMSRQPNQTGLSRQADRTIGFIVQINNAVAVGRLVRKIVDSAMTEAVTPSDDDEGNENETVRPDVLTGIPFLQTRFPLGSDAETVHAALLNMATTVESRIESVVADALSTLFTHAIKPQLGPIVGTAFQGRSYDVESGPATSSAMPALFGRPFGAFVSPVIRLFGSESDHQTVTSTTPTTPARALTTTMATTTMHPSIAFANLVIGATADMVEKRIWSLGGRISPVGAVALDRDIAAIADETVRLASPAGRAHDFADAFVRPIQIGAVVGMDDDEYVHVRSHSDGGWVLTLADMDRARNLLRRRR